MDDRAFSLEREALRASGIRDDLLIARYLEKLDLIHLNMLPELTRPWNPVEKARVLFEWLWREKPGRYKPQGNFRLSHVIDAQISKNIEPVGNCLGLTVLYNCLLKKQDMDTGALYMENAFGAGPHILTLLRVEQDSMDIENIFPHGFDYQGHRHSPLRTVWGDRELVADIYHSSGNEFFEKGKFSEALVAYGWATRLNPSYERARLNKMILQDRIRMMR